MTKNYAFDHVRVPWWSDMLMWWLEDQVAIAFHSHQHPSADREAIIKSLKLENLNHFLQERGCELLPFNEDDLPHPPDTCPSNSERDDKPNLNDPIGKYVFSSPVDQGSIVVGFFHIKPHHVFHVPQDVTSMSGSPGMNGGGESMTHHAVNILNANLEMLKHEGKVPIIAAMPNWLGGTTCFVHGCSFSPIPVRKDDVSVSQPGGWSITLPDLSDTMQAMTGKDVTVFVLDTMPKLDQIMEASESAGDSNWLLQDIVSQVDNGTIKLTYQALPKLLREDAEDQLVTGRDIYGRTAGLPMADHGLFVTGIIHDLARSAKIEYIRILNNFGTGSCHMLIHELEKIQQRMAPANVKEGKDAGDLHNQPVLINFSFVLTPPQDHLPELWFGASSGGGDHAHMMSSTDLLRAPLQVVIESMTALGAVIVGAAGNDSNSPDMPNRTEARYPAAFPDVISVGAVDKADSIVMYSNYPALLPHRNGIVTYGGGLATPVPPTGENVASSTPLYGPDDASIMTTATNVDALRGIYTSPLYPALSADDPRAFYHAPTESAWAYWSGTSFAAPIISAVVARMFEHMKLSEAYSSTHSMATEVRWAITTAEGQQAMLTGDASLPVQPDFGLGMLKAVQEYQQVEGL